MTLTIAHLYPDLLNLYGDIGNVKTIVKRCQWRGIDVCTVPIVGDEKIRFDRIDLAVLGGGSDREQLLVRDKLLARKRELAAYVEDGGAVLAVCGGYQLLGSWYKTKEETIEGLQILDVQTETGDGRLIGNVVIENDAFGTIVGFENHGGRTFINGHTPLGRVLAGCGNNGQDGTEGVIWRNVVATYLHGSLLPKNPRLCDHIIRSMLLRRGVSEELAPLDDTLELEAHRYIEERTLRRK